MIDDQQSTHDKPKEVGYIDNDAFIFTEFNGQRDNLPDTLYERLQYFFQTNIATILPSLKKQVEEGKLVFVMPEDLQGLTRSRSWQGINSKSMIYDLRSDKRRQADQLGYPSTSLSKNLAPYKVKPIIKYIEEMDGPTEPSLWHCKQLNAIVMVLKSGANWRKTLFKLYNDKAPFEFRQEKFVFF